MMRGKNGKRLMVRLYDTEWDADGAVVGIKDEDTYLYNDSIQHGRVLVQVLTDASCASQAWRLLAQVNIEARA